MDINLNIRFISDPRIDTILKAIQTLGKNMATFQDVLSAVSAEQDVIKASIQATQTLVVEVKKLLAANDLSGADALLTQIADNTAALTASIVENTDASALVDAANG